MVQLGKADVRCLLDTRCASVHYHSKRASTITSLMKRDWWMLQPYIRITAANGLGIPYRGYFEADVTMFGQTFRKMGFLVVEDPTSTSDGGQETRCSWGYWRKISCEKSRISCQQVTEVTRAAIHGHLCSTLCQQLTLTKRDMISRVRVCGCDTHTNSSPVIKASAVFCARSAQWSELSSIS